MHHNGPVIALMDQAAEDVSGGILRQSRRVHDRLGNGHSRIGCAFLLINGINKRWPEYHALSMKQWATNDRTATQRAKLEQPPSDFFDVSQEIYQPRFAGD